MKRLFEDMPDEDRRQVQKLSLKMALLAEEKSRMEVQVAGLSQ